MIIKLLLAHKFKVLVVALAYTILLLYVSLDTVKTAIDFPSQSDKLFHALAYFIFTILWCFVHQLFSKAIFNKTLVHVILFALAFGVLVEFLQHFLTINREGDIQDVFANALGILFAVVVLKYFILKTVKS